MINQCLIFFLTFWLLLANIQHINGKAYCTASIYIDRSPDKVWVVLTDPYKFANKKHMKKIEVLENRTDYQKLRYTCGIFFPIPDFVVTVESKLSPNYIAFNRVNGAFRDLRGYWKLTRKGQGTLVEYSMYLDCGFFIPQWVVERAQMKEIPETLEDFKKRAEK